MKQFFTWIWRSILISITLVALFVLGSALPIDGNYEFMIVESGSMEPAIKTGAVLAYVPRSEYQIGDIVTFTGTSVNPTPTTHRIVDAVTEGEQLLYVTKGDANEDLDYRRIQDEDILGKVFFAVPYAGYAATYFGTPNGKAVMVVTTIILLAITFIPWRRLLVKNQNESN